MSGSSFSLNILLLPYAHRFNFQLNCIGTLYYGIQTSVRFLNVFGLSTKKLAIDHRQIKHIRFHCTLQFLLLWIWFYFIFSIHWVDENKWNTIQWKQYCRVCVMLFFNYSIKICSTSMTCWREIVTVQAKLFCDHQSVFILNYDKNIESTIFFFFPKNGPISKKYSMFVILIFLLFIIGLLLILFCKSYLVHFMWLLMTFIYVLDDLNKNANHDCGCGGGGSHQSG